MNQKGKSKLRMICILAAFISTIGGCNKEDTTDNKTSSQKKDTVKTEVIKSSFKGIYTTNINTSTLQDCSNPDSTYIVIDGTGKLQDQFKKIFPVPSIYSSVAVEVKGELKPNEDTRTNEKHHKVLLVKDVESIGKKSFDNYCMPYDYWIFGKDKEWTLSISSKENLIEMDIPGENKSYYFFYAESKNENGLIVYSNYNQIQKTTIKITLRKEKCISNKTGKEYEYSAEVELNNNSKFAGCAIKGKDSKAF